MRYYEWKFTSRSPDEILYNIIFQKVAIRGVHRAGNDSQVIK